VVVRVFRDLHLEVLYRLVHCSEELLNINLRRRS
jgi:hypothetical protein